MVEEEDSPEQFFSTSQPLSTLAHIAHLTSQQQRELEAINPPGLFHNSGGTLNSTEGH